MPNASLNAAVDEDGFDCNGHRHCRISPSYHCILPPGLSIRNTVPATFAQSSGTIPMLRSRRNIASYLSCNSAGGVCFASRTCSSTLSGSFDASGNAAGDISNPCNVESSGSSREIVRKKAPEPVATSATRNPLFGSLFFTEGWIVKPAMLING